MRRREPTSDRALIRILHDPLDADGGWQRDRHAIRSDTLSSCRVFSDKAAIDAGDPCAAAVDHDVALPASRGSPPASGRLCCAQPRRAVCMHAYVYKSLNKADTYVYLAGRDAFERLPDPLRNQLGKLAFVLDVDLSGERRLAREDPNVVRDNLAARGFHIQFPPTVGDPMTSDWGTDA